jgi:S1-C subfamily serine protease
MTTMEDLTKTQIVLLTLLVSFITSIATGIITTSLLAQAPQGVTQTIDRVVERTVERVAPATTGGTVREVTVVKEGDAIVGSVEAAIKSIVRINSPANTEGVQTFYALGIVVGKGLVLSDKRGVNVGGTYTVVTVVFSDGTSLPATSVAQSETGSLALFRLTADEMRLRGIPIVTLSKADPKLGQTVIAMEGRDRPAIAVGRVLSIDKDAGVALTDIAPATETQGGALLDLSGVLVGLKTSNADLTLPASTYTVASSLARFVEVNQ